MASSEYVVTLRVYPKPPRNAVSVADAATGRPVPWPPIPRASGPGLTYSPASPAYHTHVRGNTVEAARVEVDSVMIAEFGAIRVSGWTHVDGTDDHTAAFRASGARAI